MLQRRHITSAMLIFDSLIFDLVAHRTKMENLIKAVPARLNLQRVRKEDKDRDGKLPDSDEQRSRRVHFDDVRTDLWKMSEYNVVNYRWVPTWLPNVI